MTKHTATPWTIVKTDYKTDSVIFGADDLDVCETNGKDNTQKEANATFIVNAVNSHDELISLVKLLDQHEGSEGWSKGMRERIDNVIAKAEGK